jgi:hypothetical protein
MCHSWEILGENPMMAPQQFCSRRANTLLLATHIARICELALCRKKANGKTYPLRPNRKIIQIKPFDRNFLLIGGANAHINL